MSVLEEWAQVDTHPVERPGFSFVFSSWPALTGTRTDWCPVHTSRWSFQGFFGFAWSISSQKGSSNGHERWTKSGSLIWGKRSPACAALHCLQTDLLLSGGNTKLRSGICFGPGVSGLGAIGSTGILVIWKWHLDTGWEIQSSPWETRPLCTFREVIEMQKAFFPLPGNREGSSGRNCWSRRECLYLNMQRSPSISWLVAIFQVSLFTQTLSIPYKDGAQKSLVAVARAQQLEWGTVLLLIPFPPNDNFAFLFHLILLQLIHLDPGTWQEGANQDAFQLCSMFLEGALPIWWG